ncbi:MAG: MepB family protein [Cytophagales bacterium]|nr:MepB family protein [Cytophaga sp.]
MPSENNWSALPSIPKDLVLAKVLIYDRLALICTNPVPEIESVEYSAHTFSIHNSSIVFRIAKITPTKTGQFVTLWKRIGNGPIQPFDSSDDIDLVIISVRDNNHCGQFILPKSVLVEKGIFSGNGREGKRAFRVYPSWDEANSKQAQKTKEWQSVFFLEIPILIDKEFDIFRAKQLLVPQNSSH